MLFRPSRLLRNALREISGKSLYGREHQAVKLVTKEFLGAWPVVAIETDSHTFIAEGLASHNCNFWRAVQRSPEQVAFYADAPVNENDLHARHSWLIQQRDTFVPRLEGDPEFYDAKIAGWWCWGICCWIGGGWCSGQGPWQVVDGQLVHLGDKGLGVKRQLVHLRHKGMGVNQKRVHLGNKGLGEGPEAREGIYAWFASLSERLRYVRVCSGDWSRVCGPTPTVKQGLTGVFLDPPYAVEDRSDCYRVENRSVAHDVCEWAIQWGDNPGMRIALCGYEGEHQMPESWTCVPWKAHGGFASQSKKHDNPNARRERIWFSPHCIVPLKEQRAGQMALFGEGARRG